MSHSNTSSPSAGNSEYFNNALPATPQEVWAGGPGNIYGFYVEERGNAGDAYLCFYDAANAGAVSGAPDKVYRVKQDQSLGRDPVGASLHHFSSGCCITVCDNADGTSPRSDAAVHIWFKARGN